MEQFLRDLFVKYDSLQGEQKKKLLIDLSLTLELQKKVNPPIALKVNSDKHEKVEKLKDIEDLILYERLKAWRLTIAKDLCVSAFIVFPNVPLINIAYYKPTNEKDLMKCYGVGVEKIKNYGPALIEIVTQSMDDFENNEAYIHNNEMILL